MGKCPNKEMSGCRKCADEECPGWEMSGGKCLKGELSRREEWQFEGEWKMFTCIFLTGHFP